MTPEVKPMRPVKMSDKEISDELVNDSLGEVTPADSTGPGPKNEPGKREQQD